MKTIFFIILTVLLYQETKCQNIIKTEKNVHSTNKIIFYGYDFSNFKLADSKRINQNLKGYIFELMGFYSSNLPQQILQDLLLIDTVTINYNSTLILNKKIVNEDIISPVKYTIEKDSIQNMINKYSNSKQSEIGMVIVFECFDDNTKSVTAYSVYFDSFTKKILKYDYINHFEEKSYNNFKDWKEASLNTIKELSNKYTAKREGVQSQSEKLISKVLSEKKYTEELYGSFGSIKIGDMIVFTTDFNEKIYGIVTELTDRNSVKFKSFPSMGQQLIWEEKFNSFKKVKY